MVSLSQMAVYATAVNRIKFAEWTSSLDLEARAEEEKRKAAIARIETVTVRIKRQVRSTDEAGADAPYAPALAGDIIRQLWRQHFIALEPHRIRLKGGLEKFGMHSVPVALGEGETETQAELSVQLSRR